jgi:hypothetical protein
MLENDLKCRIRDEGTGLKIGVPEYVGYALLVIFAYPLNITTQVDTRCCFTEEAIRYIDGMLILVRTI